MSKKKGKKPPEFQYAPPVSIPPTAGMGAVQRYGYAENPFAGYPGAPAATASGGWGLPPGAPLGPPVPQSGYNPYAGYVTTPPAGYNPYAGYVTTPSLGAGGLGLEPPAAPTERGSWYGDNPYRFQDWQRMLNDEWTDYGLTWGQNQAGYVPGASERNAYGQPLGTLAPYGQRRTRRNAGGFGWASGAGTAIPYGQNVFGSGGLSLMGKVRRGFRGRENLRGGGGGGGGAGGSGTAPAWVNGLAQLNV